MKRKEGRKKLRTRKIEEENKEGSKERRKEGKRDIYLPLMTIVKLN